jgi:uncharacterized membrane protein
MSGRTLDRVMAAILLGGVTLSAALMVAALAGAIFVGWSGSLVGQPASTRDPTDFSQLVHSLLLLRPIATAKLGLLVLLATPVLRVAVSVGAFAIQRDATYVVISLGVLAILLLSLFVLH